MNRPTISVTGVGVSYGDHVALRDVTLHAHAGEIVALVGPNGAGKSSLLRAIMGLQAHDGEVTVYTARPRAAAVAFVPQRADVDLQFPITLEQVVADGRRPFVGPWRPLRGVDRRAVEQAIATVALDGLQRRGIGELSGGQLQRAFIARALAQEAELLLLDEPLTGVDTPTGESLVNLLQTLAVNGRTIMLSTHDLAQVRHRFARCVVLNRTVLADGAPADVLRTERLEQIFLAHA
ncbi:MAG TPA: metal ABC transporter ATP-binding protein [Conexibacter sp.]